MKKIWLLTVIVIAGSRPGWAIYGPSLTRTDTATALRACKEAQFTDANEIAEAVQSRDPAKAVLVMSNALIELKSTHVTADNYAARAFCVHELVPGRLPREGAIASPAATQTTTLVKQFADLGIEYFYYDPDAEWTLKKNPVDLKGLASAYLDSPWGHKAFLMMTELGWSEGACQEGPDQFREVIIHSEEYLVDYPDSEVSNDIRLELAHAYATWWNLSRSERNPPYEYPETYKVGAAEAKQGAIELYQRYLKAQKTPAAEIEKQLKALQRNQSGDDKFDFFCPDYED
jgi:hypothetical protein